LDSQWYSNTEVLEGKPVTVIYFPKSISHEVTRDRTRVYAMKDRPVTASALA